MKQGKKNLIVFALFVTAMSNLHAQDAAEVKARINQIKRDTTYLYGDATMQNESDAVSLAKDFLKAAVRQWLNEKELESVVLKTVDHDEIVSWCDTMTVIRGGMYRGFAYISKYDLYKDEFRPSEPEPMVIDKIVISSSSQTVISSSGLTVTVEKEDVPEQEMKEPDLGEVFKTGLVDMPDMEKLKAFLNTEPFACIYDHGPVDFSTDPAVIAGGYLVVYDAETGVIASVLSPKNPKRTNLRTGETDSTVNYAGYNAWWICKKQQ